MEGLLSVLVNETVRGAFVLGALIGAAGVVLVGQYVRGPSRW